MIVPQEPERISELIAARVTVTESGCWLWPQLRSDGYGVVKIDGLRWRVHRLVWHHLVMPLSKAAVVHHRCGVRACCNPDHLQATSSHANNAEMMARQALLSHIAVLEAEVHDLMEEVVALSAELAEHENAPPAQ